ncbi:hypothetical protein [Pelagicoccus sp. SDUM812003]|uniref:hypothetical protein n=1 Tax=Pelagicoccus sp. SDUM812003 TaxID=3041267 RepID=UPI00280F835D|nr:hypothetical protein [Pelagicoccus sp. SDUM812003]MDQ8203250.1 hypothetical protein [Pelagicoccus sp. SDUM812003]
MRTASISLSLNKLFSLALIGLSLVPALRLEAQVKYELIVPDVYGSLPTQTQIRGNEINEQGQTLLNRLATFAIWENGRTTAIVDARSDFPATLSRLTASSINSYTQVVGSKTYLVRGESGMNYQTFPFYWDSTNGLVDLEDIGDHDENGAGYTTLYGINEKGASIGVTRSYLDGAPIATRGFVWSFETGRVDIQPLDTVGFASCTTPSAINDQGTVVGIYNRYFSDSPDHYYENGFIHSEAFGTHSLDELDAAFFSTANHTARDVSNAGLIVGERGREAYVYNMNTAQGTVIPGFDGGRGQTRAYAINEQGVVAGYGEVFDQKGKIGYAPLLWTETTGSIDLSVFLANQPSEALPQGLDLLDCIIAPKSVNQQGQISAQLRATSGDSFSREVVLTPTSAFKWTEMRRATEDGKPGMLLFYDKASQQDTIPAAAIGLELEFFCSDDMKSWQPLDLDGSAIRYVENDSSIELFVPFETCLFIKTGLKASSATNSVF